MCGVDCSSIMICLKRAAVKRTYIVENQEMGTMKTRLLAGVRSCGIPTVLATLAQNGLPPAADQVQWSRGSHCPGLT